MEIKGLYKLKREQEEMLIKTYIDAFRTYPKLDLAFPDKEAKAAALEATLRFYVAYDMEYGAAFSLDEEVREGVCLVFSGEMHYTQARHEKAGSYSAAYKAAMGRLTEEQQRKRDALFEELDRLEKALELPEPHLYVDFLGVRGDSQHQGRGRKLMSAICQYAQQQGLPLMLFTNTEDDVAFYESLGFHVVGVVRSEEFGFVNTYLVKEAGEGGAHDPHQ